MQVTDVLIGCGVGIALAILSYSVGGRLRKAYFFYKQKKMKARIVQKLMHLALAQRSTFRIEVLDGDFKGFTGEAVCNTAGKNNFILQIVDTFGAHQWTNVPIRMFFPINQKGKISFYHFTCVAHESMRKSSFTELVLALPDAIEPGQNRESLRFSPPKDRVLALGMWILNASKPLPTHKKDLAKPQLTYTAKGNNDMGLDNISAGGMCVFIHERQMWERSKYMKPGAHLLFLVVLANKTKEAPPPKAEAEGGKQEAKEAPVQNKTMSFWLSCRVRALLHIEKENFWRVCLQFDAWSLIEGEVSTIEWFPADSTKSVPPLSTWIMRTHLETVKNL